MKEIYAKTVLYAYPVLDALAEQIEELIEKKAYVSMTDFSSALGQCEKIVDLTNQKTNVLYLKKVTGEIFSKFTEEEMKLVDYKYLKLQDRSEYENFDYSSRRYFRAQNRVSKKFAEKLSKKGITDYDMEKIYFTMDFFKALLKGVKQREAAFEKTAAATKSEENVGVDISEKSAPSKARTA